MITPDYIPIIREQLKRHEGVRYKPYKDTVGKLTIGIGRNLDDVGLSHDEVDYLFENDLTHCIQQIRTLIPVFDTLTPNRQAVVLNMLFNLGYEGFRKFINTRQAINEGRYEDAARGMENSKWYEQVKYRAKELVALMRSG